MKRTITLSLKLTPFDLMLINFLVLSTCITTNFVSIMKHISMR